MAMHVVYHMYYIPSLHVSGRGGQDRARGRHFTAANKYAVHIWPIQPVWGGGGGCCPLLTDSTSGAGGGGGCCLL